MIVLQRHLLVHGALLEIIVKKGDCKMNLFINKIWGCA